MRSEEEDEEEDEAKSGSDSGSEEEEEEEEGESKSDKQWTANLVRLRAHLRSHGGRYPRQRGDDAERKPGMA